MTEASTSRQHPLPETVEFIWEETRGAVDAQIQRSENLDAKAFQAIGVGSVLIGLVAVGANALLAAPPATRWLLVAAVVSYALAALFTFLSVNVRRYRLGNRADELWPTRWQFTPLEIKHALAADLSSAYRHNEAELRQKTRWLRAALAAMAVEAILIGTTIAGAIGVSGD